MILSQQIIPFGKRGEPLNTPKRQVSKRTHPAQRIIEAIKIAESENQPEKNNALLSTLEDLGLIIGIIRRQKNFSMDELAAHVNIPPEALLALEAGILSCSQVCETLPSVLTGMGISLKKIEKGMRE